MSRSNYSDDLSEQELNLWRGAVASAIRGKRGQILLRDLLKALDSMPKRELIVDELENTEGKVCALGAVGKARGISLSVIDPDLPEEVAKAFDISPALAAEIVFENDEAGYHDETSEQRWQRMRKWVLGNIKK